MIIEVNALLVRTHGITATTHAPKKTLSDKVISFSPRSKAKRNTTKEIMQDDAVTQAPGPAESDI